MLKHPIIFFHLTFLPFFYPKDCVFFWKAPSTATFGGKSSGEAAEAAKEAGSHMAKTVDDFPAIIGNEAMK